MRIMVLFDLPTESSEEKREYRKFRKYLLKNGFIMMQWSVYSKLVLNPVVGNAVISNVRKNKPRNGLVQMLMVTEKQFSHMEIIVGELQTEVIDTEDRLVIL
jgi:CRISPR-associated protein Cas2